MNRILILALVVLITGAPITAQKISLKGLKKKVEQKIRVKKSQKEDQAIDKGLEKIEESIEGSDQADEEISSQQDRMPSAEDPQEIDPQVNDSQGTDPQVWSRYNFVPGDKIIFADDQMGEENGEFPSRWDLLEGNAENASMDGVNIINLKNNTVIMPFVDSANYLPEVFTIEFDAYFDNKVNPQYHRYLIRLWPGTGSWFSFGKNGKDYYYSINLYQYGAHLNGSINGQKKEFKSYLGELKSNDPGWRHIAIAFNKRSLKMFVDQYRVFNIPNLGFKPEMFSLGVLTQADGDNKQIKAIKD
ncbi:MAG: hypothetical protein OER04_17525, partial [Cyclobacteriaceae bacterium]|nr:hypothetical protein [Cyclobacteriaceae bacterium]